MAHLLRIIKVARLKLKWKRYTEEKGIGLNEGDSDVEFSSSFNETLRGCWLTGLLRRIKTPNTTENFLAMSLIGFVGGILLTYLLFVFLFMGVSFSLRTTTCICGVTGVVLCLSLAFSSEVRCNTLLLFPVFFTKQGRQALLAYALFLAFTGPAKNTMYNLRILSDSMTCGQEMVKRTLEQIIDMVKVPFKSIKETLEKTAKMVKKIVKTVNTYVMKLKRIIVSVLNVIENAAAWLGSIVNLCNAKMGTPFQRCMKTFDDAIADCKAKLGVLDFLCHVVHIVKALCYTVKQSDFICMCTERSSEKVIGLVKRRLRNFHFQMKNSLYVSLEFSRMHRLETVAANATKEVSQTFLGKIRKKVEKLQSVFSFFGFSFALIFPFLLLKAYYYKYKYLSSDLYDNFYISRYIVELDVKRAQMNRETILPLERREKEIYGKTTSIRLVKMEKLRFTQSMFFLTLTSFKVITFLAIDYSLFWVLMSIYEAGHDASMEVEKSKLVIHVEGQSILENFYRNLGNTLQVPENPNAHLTPLRCLPDPAQPDTGRYIQIGRSVVNILVSLPGFLVGLSWLLTLAEPYGLRLRNVVMSHYYPDRARERAVWLYNHILQSRGSFLRYARRHLRRKFGENFQRTGQVTLTQRLFDGFPPFDVIFGKNTENDCLLCGMPESKKTPLKRCKIPGCQGRYDLKCYAILENVCTICQHPIQYGDVSDISEEIDSSEEDLCNRKPREANATNFGEDPGSEKFLTFKDMELRDRFVDVEANKLTDYAKLSDLYHDKDALKRRLKEVLHRQIENSREKSMQKMKTKQSKYKQIKNKVQDLISYLKRKKSRRILQRKSALRKKFAEKLHSLKNFKQNKASERESLLLDCKPQSSESRLDSGYEAKPDYKMLKEKLRAQIDKLKAKKSSSPEMTEKCWRETARKSLDCDSDS